MPSCKLSLLFPRIIQGKETNSLYAFKECVQLHQYFLNILKGWSSLVTFLFRMCHPFFPILLIIKISLIPLSLNLHIFLISSGHSKLTDTILGPKILINISSGKEVSLSPLFFKLLETYVKLKTCLEVILNFTFVTLHCNSLGRHGGRSFQF